MSESLQGGAVSGSVDRLAAEVVAEITDRLHAGERVDLEAYIARHPELADRLRCLLPALALLDRFSSSGPAAGDGESLCGTLGDFRLIREVGRGGMGIVYEAEQISLGRRVVLKVLPFAATMDPRHLQRFQNEARAAASLQHANIVPVYAVGCERAVHFYAMQFIEGQSLAELIAAQGQAAASAGRQPSATTAVAAPTEAPRDAAYFRRIAEWGIQAALALEHAHALGIVHRDVKPANLIVDGQGKLWVTDFGLARTVTDFGLTMTGDLVGTLRYMSPEQALAKHGLVDHRTDVYGLGATLYELLTGRPAVEGQDRQEILRRIAEEEPRPPRALGAAVPADLETIVLKAMEKNPAERYATATEMAEDLRRFLQHEPIHARRPSLVQRVGKWSRRHRGLVVAAAVWLVAALAAFGGTTGWVMRDRAARRDQGERQAREALQEAERLQGEERWYEALAAVKRAEGALAGDSEAGLAQQVRNLHTDLDFALRLEEARLSEAAIGAEEAVGTEGTFDSAAANASYAAAFRDYGLDPGILDPQRMAQRFGGRPIRLQLAAALDHWASVRWRLKAVVGHRHFFMDALDHSASVRLKASNSSPLLGVARLLDPDPLRNQLRDFVEARDRKGLVALAQSADVGEWPAATLVVLGEQLREAGQAERAVEVLGKALQRHPADFWINFLMGYSFEGTHPRRPEEAIRYYWAALVLRPKNSAVHLRLGLALYHKGERDMASREFREALRIKPGNNEAHAFLGTCLADDGHLDEAIAEYRQAVHLNPALAGWHTNLGSLLKKRGLLDEAVIEYREAVRLDPHYLDFHTRLASALWDNGQRDEGLAEYREAIRVGPSASDDDAPFGPNLQAAYSTLGDALLERRLYPHAVEAFRRAHELAVNDPHTPSHFRYKAACAAAQASCSQEKDASGLPDKDYVRLRRQALEWLRADLAAYGAALEKAPDKAGPTVRERMQQWQQDTDFACVRGPEALARLPEAERADWQKLWQDVEALRQRTAKP